MGAGSVIGRTPDQLPAQRPSWKLKRPHDAQTQGIVVSGFSDLPAAKALFLMCDWPENGPGAGIVKMPGKLQHPGIIQALLWIRPPAHPRGCYRRLLRGIGQ